MGSKLHETQNLAVPLCLSHLYLLLCITAWWAGPEGWGSHKIILVGSLGLGAEQARTETWRNMGVLGALYKIFSFLGLKNMGFAPLLCS